MSVVIWNGKVCNVKEKLNTGKLQKQWMESNWSQESWLSIISDRIWHCQSKLFCVPRGKKSYKSTILTMITQCTSECLNGQYHTLSLFLQDCKLCALVWCLCPCLLPRTESGESISFCQALPLGASISARPERLNLHWSIRGVSASADGPGHSTHLPAQHSHRGQTCYQPEKFRYLH